ncbi:MAG: benzoate/H(+) symporter BenE family transporter [Gemmobacter sp.]|nr:benzoate/H(+) symporter BenE family transporter [Gemmobacter sp.]
MQPGDLAGVPVHVPRLTFIVPKIRSSGLLGLGVTLFLVTMASQDLPGYATLRAMICRSPATL